MSTTIKKRRDYRYKIPVDDRRAMRKINYLDSLGIRLISHLNRNEAAGRRTIGELAYEFYETYDGEGRIPGLSKYEYSRQWKPFPTDGRLEMRPGNRGGTKIRGDRYVGNELFQYVWVDFTTAFTPGDIRAMHNGKSVPDPNYLTRGEAPKIGAEDALDRLRDEFDWAETDALDAALDSYHEARRAALTACDHGEGKYLDRIPGGSEAYCGACEYSFMREELEKIGLEIPERNCE